MHKHRAVYISLLYAMSTICPAFVLSPSELSQSRPADLHIHLLQNPAWLYEMYVYLLSLVVHFTSHTLYSVMITGPVDYMLSALHCYSNIDIDAGMLFLVITRLKKCNDTRLPPRDG